MKTKVDALTVKSGEKEVEPILSKRDMTTGGVAQRLLAILRESGLQAVRPSGWELTVSDTLSVHRVVLEVDCGPVWRADEDKQALRIVVKTSYHAKNKFKITNYPVTNGNFNYQRILTRVRSGLEYLREVEKSDSERRDERQQKDQMQKKELGRLRRKIGSSGATVSRLGGDERPIYAVKWSGFVHLGRLPDLLDALTKAKRP